jgi:hypothetical protein
MRNVFVRLAVAAAIAGQLGCGAILYPERAGQSKGRIDPAVAVLDGIGVLLFIIPGLVAFAVDFHQGTIYLPPGETAAASWRPVAVAEPLSPETIEATVRAQTGTEVSLADPRMNAYRIHRIEEAPVAGSY